MFGINKNLESPDMAWMLWMYTPWTTDMQIRVWYPVCKLGSVVSTAFIPQATFTGFHIQVRDNGYDTE